MSPREVYSTRIAEFSTSAEKLQKKSNRLSVARLLVFAGGLTIFVVLSALSVFAAVAAITLSLILFAWLVIRYDTIEKLRRRFLRLTEINSLELRCLEGDFSSYKSGEEYSERDHPYSYDLDIFGKASLYQYICRTTSKPAGDMLAEFLKKSAGMEEILIRQEAVKELSPMTGWRQELMATGSENSGPGNNPDAIMQWLKGDDIFTKPTREKILTWSLSALAVASIILAIAGLPAAIMAPAFAINFLLYFSRFKRITKLHEQVSRSDDFLKAYSEMTGLIEKERFTSAKLTGLQASFRGPVPASVLIRRLSKLVNRLDWRLNAVMSIPLNLLLFTDIHFCLALEKWKRDHASKISEWFSAMSEFEALSSFANMTFNNPAWKFPTITPDFFGFRAENIGHPLIPEKNRVNNDFAADGTGKAIVITGSNMSGKSTFLRTCGVNAALALAGAPVCASSFTMSHARIHTSMRISDSLEENISSFYAELRRLRSIISGAEDDNHAFLLLDEILRGTNSDDRYTGSVALIKQLTGYGTVSMIATHDLRLAGMENEMPESITNYHFDVKVNGEELFFDYKLTPGICTSFNASLLMKKMGIKVNHQ